MNNENIEELAFILRKTSCNIDICDVFYDNTKQDIINKAKKNNLG